MSSALREVQFFISGHSLRKAQSKSLYVGMVDPSHEQFTACSLDETATGLLELICITGGENHDFLYRRRKS